MRVMPPAHSRRGTRGKSGRHKTHGWACGRPPPRALRRDCGNSHTQCDDALKLMRLSNG